MCKGFIRIPKRLFETRWWNQKRVYSESDAIIDLYSSADRKNMVEVSIRSLADKWYWEQTKVLRFIAKLVKDGYIESTKSPSGTVIKIIDFGQSATQGATPSATPQEKKCNTSTPINKGFDEGQCNTPSVASATPSATPSATLSRVYKNDNIISCLNEDNKNNKNPLNPPRGYESYDFAFLDDSFRDVFFLWLDYKRERKEKYKSSRSIEQCYRNLKKLSSDNPDTARLIVEQSIGNNWAGLFQLKEQKYETTATTQHANQVSGHPTDSELRQQSVGIMRRLSAERHARNQEVRQRDVFPAEGDT